MALKPASRLWLLLAAVVVLVPLAAAAQGLPVNSRAPVFRRAAVSGPPVDLARLGGRVILLNFWASWCAPCLIETPRFVAWQQTMGPKGLSIVGVSMDDSVADVRAVAPRLRWNYPVVMGNATLGRLYGGVLGLPVSYLIDRKGRVRARFEGEADLGAMERQLRALLAEPASQ